MGKALQGWAAQNDKKHSSDLSPSVFLCFPRKLWMLPISGWVYQSLWEISFLPPFHKVTESTLELDMRTRSQPWRVADFLRQDTCPGNVSHAFLLLEKCDICFVLYTRCAKNISMRKLTRHLVRGGIFFVNTLQILSLGKILQSSLLTIHPHPNHYHTYWWSILNACSSILSSYIVILLLCYVYVLVIIIITLLINF